MDPDSALTVLQIPDKVILSLTWIHPDSDEDANADTIPILHSMDHGQELYLNHNKVLALDPQEEKVSINGAFL